MAEISQLFETADLIRISRYTCVIPPSAGRSMPVMKLLRKTTRPDQAVIDGLREQTRQMIYKSKTKEGKK